MVTPRKRPEDLLPRGRKPDPVRARRRLLQTRVTDTELGMCLGAAEACGESLGDWLRRVALRAAL